MIESDPHVRARRLIRGQLIAVLWLVSAATTPRAAEPVSAAIEPLVAHALRAGGDTAFTFDPDDLRGDTRTLPIGVFDSGIGGLTVLEAILALDAFDNRSLQPVPDGVPDFAGERFVYLGDQANMPYGQYPREGNEPFLRELILKDAVFLLGRRFWPARDAAAPRLDKPAVKSIVVACNTATAYGLADIRGAIDRWGVPVRVVGVVEAGARGVLQSDRAGRDDEAVAVLATVGTCSSLAYPKAIAAAFGRAGRRVPRVVQRGSADLAGAIEGDPAVTARTTVEQAIAADVAALVDEQRRDADARPVGTVVLGCTHFPLVREAIVAEFMRLRDTAADGGRLIAETIEVVDPASLAARELFRTLAAQRLRAPAARTSDLPDLFFISVAGPAANETAPADKFHRVPGRLGVEDTRVVPMRADLLPPTSRALIRTRLPHVWRTLGW